MGTESKHTALLRTWVRRKGRGRGQEPAGHTGSGGVPSGKPGPAECDREHGRDPGENMRILRQPGQFPAAKRPWQWR